jgi:hypothetical protein
MRRLSEFVTFVTDFQTKALYEISKKTLWCWTSCQLSSLTNPLLAIVYNSIQTYSESA